MSVTVTSNTLANSISLSGEYTSSALASDGVTAREGARVQGLGSSFALRRVSEATGAGTRFVAPVSDLPDIEKAAKDVRDSEVAGDKRQVLAIGVDGSRIEYVPGSDRIDLVDADSTESWAPASGAGGGFAVIIAALTAARSAAGLAAI